MEEHETWGAGSVPTWRQAAQASRIPQLVALFLLSFGLITLWYLWNSSSGYAKNLVGDLMITGTAGTAAFLCLRTGRRLGATGRPWLLLGWGCVAWFSGQVVWDVYQLGPARQAPYPSLADVGFFLFRPLCFAGIVGIIRPGRLRVSLDLVLDILIVVTVVAAFDYQLVLAPLWDGSTGGTAATFVSLASQVGTLALVLLALIAFLWSPALRSQPAVFLVVGGLVVFAGANLVYGKLITTRAYGIGHPIDLGWIASFLLFGMAALLAERAPVMHTDTPPGGQWRTSVVSRLVVIVLSVLGVSALAAYSALSSEVMAVSAIAIVLVGVTIAVRLANDIIDRQRTEGRLAGIRDQALEASRLKSEFLATMSHEIRTPMNGVLGTLELLLDTDLSRQQLDLASTAWESADALLTILNDILDLSRIEAGKMLLETVDFDPGSVVEGAAEVLAGRAHAKKLLLVTYVAPDIPSLLGGDPTRLRQVVINLIANAVKFTDEGEVTVRATLERMTVSHATIRITVSDTGIGLSAESQTRLFHAFSQADASTTRRYGGTGLGLVISRRLVELMDGAVGVRSKVGQGSTFWITARFERLAQSSDAASAMTSGTLQIASEAVSPLVAQHLPTSFVVTPTLADEDTDGRLVLLAEDHQVNQKVARMQLENLGYQVVVVNTGRQAVDALVDRDRYGLVLMDVQMPELDGFSATRLIRKAEIEGGRRIPIIAMTASTMEGDRDACLAAGMDAYISKPVNRDSLREVLEAWMPPVEDTGEKFLDSRQSVPAG